MEQEIRALIHAYFNDEFTITFTYAPKKLLKTSYEEFIASYDQLYHDEQRFGRSLFGAHLDDFTINFQDIKSKNYASRGSKN